MSRPSPLLAAMVAAFALAFVPFLAHCIFAEHQPVLPRGCDEFGYLQMAHAFDEGTGLGPHVSRPFDTELVTYLKGEGIPTADFALMIAPHAYHFDDRAAQVINQYPPGTSYLLSFLPKAYRYAWFPALCGLLLTAPLLAVFWFFARSADYAFRIGAVLVTAVTCVLTPPLDMGFEVITSIGPTYGLLIAAGFLLRERPGLAIAILGATTVFRIANVVLAVPFLAWFVWRAGASRFGWRDKLRASVTGGLLFGCGGFFLLLAYTWTLLGSPLRTTYTKRDTNLVDGEGFLHNLDYYFNVSAPWMWLHAVLLALLVVAAMGNRALLRFALVGAAMAAMNYTFFLLHAMPISYYPYASALVLLGMLLHTLDTHPGLTAQRRQFAVLAGFGVLLVLPTIRVPTLFAEEQFADAVRVHKETLDEFDVVWAGLHSGTAEYAADTVGFRYFYGSPEARVKTVRWLRDHGYAQALWVDTAEFDRDLVVRELKAHGIAFQERRSRLGPLLVVRAD